MAISGTLRSFIYAAVTFILGQLTLLNAPSGTFYAFLIATAIFILKEISQDLSPASASSSSASSVVSPSPSTLSLSPSVPSSISAPSQTQAQINAYGKITGSPTLITASNKSIIYPDSTLGSWVWKTDKTQPQQYYAVLVPNGSVVYTDVNPFLS